jgi:starch synthase
MARTRRAAPAAEPVQPPPLPPIALIASEIAPYSKTGGLGDVTGALAHALAEAGHRVVTLSPRYRGPATAEAVDTGLRLPIPLAGAVHEVAVWHLPVGPVDHLFLSHAMYERDGIYGDARGSFGDNHLRFALLCRAALDTVRRLPLRGGPPLGEQVLLHCNDWHTALVPLYLEALYRPLGLFTRAATVLSLHNPAHQGRLPASLFSDLELPSRWFGPQGLEFYGDLGLLKGGILHADLLTTVSPTFAWEITTPGGGFGLEGLLRHRAADLSGIGNGIDARAWDPSTDPHLEATFSAEDLSGKARCKEALQRELGLPVDPTAPLLGSVGRLDPQKGVELLLESVPWCVEQGAQVVLLGSAAAAHARYEQQARELERRYPERVRAWVGFDEGLSHRIEAGADLFLMPSLFEPCGLNQMYSLRYGTPPIVRRTGGLADTVVPYDASADEGTGFWFDRPTGAALRDAIWRALQLFREDRAAFDRLVVRGMQQDFSWARVVPQYEAVYREALRRRA